MSEVFCCKKLSMCGMHEHINWPAASDEATHSWHDAGHGVIQDWPVTVCSPLPRSFICCGNRQNAISWEKEARSGGNAHQRVPQDIRNSSTASAVYQPSSLLLITGWPDGRAQKYKSFTRHRETEEYWSENGWRMRKFDVSHCTAAHELHVSASPVYSQRVDKTCKELAGQFELKLYIFTSLFYAISTGTGIK